MRRLPASTRRTFKPSDGEGISRTTSLLILFILSLVELSVTIKMLRYGSIHAVSEMVFAGWFCNWGFIVGFALCALSGKTTQTNGYMEVSNYINLNKLGKDK